ncbi:MAG: hypothetical protein ACRDS0_42105 [Pseudonocardiaceae bacterium]
MRLLAYLSYSGLGPGIERGIRHAAIAENFPRLTRAGVPVVHYWRPSMPCAATRLPGDPARAVPVGHGSW